MARYHINSKGEPGPCKAQAGGCPFGGADEHFDTPEQARDAFEAKQGSSFGAPARVDPTEEREYVIAFENAEKLKEGDEYEGEVITGKKVGRKWVTLTTPTRKEVLVPVGEKVAVQREQLTANARSAQREHDKEHMAQRAVGQAQERLDKALEELNESFKEYGHANSFRMDSLIKAQEVNQIWQSIDRIAKNKGIPHTEAIEIKVAQIKESVFNYGARSGTSRSTSVVSNIMEDAKTEAMFEFVRDNERGWY